MLKRLYKRVTGRVLRGGLAGVNERLDRIERLATASRDSLAVWRGDLRTGCAVGPGGEPLPDATSRLRAELAYWVRTRSDPSAVLTGVSDLAEAVAQWHERRLAQLAEALGVTAEAFDAWAGERNAVEIGGGPWPLIGARVWKRAVAVDPLCEGYDAEGLGSAPPGLVRVCAPGESMPLMARSADLVVCENALDHVADPMMLLESARRLLSSDGRLWLRVDLTDKTDDLHPHAFDRAALQGLLASAGLGVVWDHASTEPSRPEADSEVALLCVRAGAADQASE